VGHFESDLIKQALEHTHWNKNRAAGLLGLNRTTLLEKIKKRGIKPPETAD
jgi:DNA-binding NtrC family response regulator